METVRVHVSQTYEIIIYIAYQSSTNAARHGFSDIRYEIWRLISSTEY